MAQQYFNGDGDGAGLRAPPVAPLVDDFQEIVPYKGNSKWFSRGIYFYVCSRTRGSSVSMRCASDRCPARWILKDDLPGPVQGEHNHEPTPWIPNRNAMFQALKSRSEGQNLPLNVIYEEEAARYPDAATYLLFERVVPSMRKWRRGLQPVVPRTLLEYAVALSEHRTLSTMLFATVSVAGASAIILTMPGFDRCIGESEVLIADATFLTAPPNLGVYQILTLHCVIGSHYFHPLVVLMQNRQRVLYEAVFRRIWQAAGNPRPLHIVTDYEPALRSALGAVTGVNIQGCMFHYVQALFRRAQQLGMPAQRLNSPAWELIRLYSALALLPARQVANGLAEVQHIAQVQRLPFNQQFHEYFVAQWMTRVGPEGFSVHGAVHRTSNIAESYHATLKRSLGPHPNIWRYSDVMAQKFNVCATRLAAQRRGDLPRRRNANTSYISAATLNSNTRALERETISIREFLVQTSRNIDVVVENVYVPEIGEEVVIDDNLEPEVVLDLQEPLMEPLMEPVHFRPVSPPLMEPEAALELPAPPENLRAAIHPNQPPRCNICLENYINIVLIPCGHTQCRDCYQHMILQDIDTCAVCRALIERINPLFIN